MTLSATVRTLLVGALAAVSAACSLLPDDQAMAYLQAEEQPLTRVPAGTELAVQDAYPIPTLAQQQQRPGSFEVPRPAPYIEDNDADAVTSLNEYSSGAINARMDKDGAGSAILRLDGSYASNWAAVTEAIAASDLRLSDLNRSTGTYYLEMQTVVPAEERGWWASLWGSDEIISETYLLKMNRARNGVYLSLLTDADTLADESLTLDVLKQIKSKLEQ